MPEREPPGCPDRAEKEREEQEVARLNEVEGFIKRKAYFFADDDPMLAEDLAQEAREAVIRRLRKEPDCPYSHLVVKANDAIHRYRVRGKSVDGKLLPVGRSKQYPVFSLEAPVTDDETPLREALADPKAPRRPAEERAHRNVFFSELRERLSVEENQVLTLRLMNVSWKEAGEILDKGVGEMGRIREKISRIVREVVGA
jgi:DNA-directed RNA polymerase specialized sigma24 family protein